MTNSRYSFVVVDDEPEIREGIRNTIPWEAIGFFFAGACANGFEALELAERILPDAVLTDINMPFLDGLAFADRLREVSPRTKVLIISGYDDFEYARQAVRLSVYDYIIKPVTPDELKAVLEKLKATLDAERAAWLNLEQIKKQLAESLPLLKERFLTSLVEGKFSSSVEVVAERLSYFGLSVPLTGTAYQCLILDFIRRKEGENFDIDLLAQRNLLEGVLSREETVNLVQGILFRDGEDRLVILLWGTGKFRFSADVYRGGLKTAEGLCRELAALGFRNTVVGVGEVVETIKALGDSYETASGVLAAALLRGEGGVSVWRELEGKTGKREGLSSDQKWGAKMASALKTGDLDEAYRYVNEMMDYFKKVPLLPDECHLKCAMVLAAIMQSLEDMDILWPDIFPHSLDPFADLRQLKNLDEVRLWFMALAKAVNDYTTSRQNNFAMVKVREALEYLEVHYEDPDLSLQELCRKLDISSSYLSASLKKYHDKSFVDELTGIRMRKAMELLKTTNFLTYEIAERVGYRDAHYFSLSFHKFTGMTSTEYRNRNVHVPG